MMALLAAPTLATAQETASPSRMHFTPEAVEGRHPAAVMLAQRRPLRLTGDQVAGVEAVYARLRAENREHWAILAEHARVEGGRDGGTSADRGDGARSASYSADEARAQIKENARRAAEEALGLLTEAQRGQLISLENP